MDEANSLGNKINQLFLNSSSLKECINYALHIVCLIGHQLLQLSFPHFVAILRTSS